MPPRVARALLQGTPDSELTASLERVAIAFIALDGFSDVTARLPPRELIRVGVAYKVLACNAEPYRIPFILASSG